MTRKVERVITSQQQLEGGGFVVRRPFPTGALSLVDPFLLLDEMGPAEYAAGEAVGAPDHPHRGFETVTYMLEGAFEHEDSAGNRGAITAGDVQWMTAGRGVVHSEMPSLAIREKGGRVHGFQIWVNLPARDKMMDPRYQEVPSARIPEATSPDGLAKVRVIAGEALGREGGHRHAHADRLPGLDAPARRARRAAARGRAQRDGVRVRGQRAGGRGRPRVERRPARHPGRGRFGARCRCRRTRRAAGGSCCSRASRSTSRSRATARS